MYSFLKAFLVLMKSDPIGLPVSGKIFDSDPSVVRNPTPLKCPILCHSATLNWHSDGKSSKIFKNC